MERATVASGRLVVGLLVAQLLLNLAILGGIVVIIGTPPQDCRATLRFDEVFVVQDTDPNSVYGPIDSWWGNTTLWVGGVSLITPLDFTGDINKVQPVGATTNGKVGVKGQNINYGFNAWMHERDGAPYGGPFPWDPDASQPTVGALYCPGVYPLKFAGLFIPINNGEAETYGLLQFNYTVNLDP